MAIEVFRDMKTQAPHMSHPEERLEQPQIAQYPLITLLTVLLGIYNLTSANPIETIWSCALFLILLKWFWWSRHPGIMLFCLALPFLEIHTTLIEANQSGVTLDELFYGTGRSTFWMSSLSLLAVSFGVKSIWSIWGGGRVAISFEKILKDTQSLNQSKLVLAFFAATFFAQAIDIVISYSSSFRQLEVYANGISEAILLIVAIKFMVDRKHLWLVVVIFSYLIVTSFYSFFSSWKDPLSVLLIASLIRITHFNFRQLLRLSPILLPTLALLLIWQNIKGEYRQFLNGGKFSQQVVVTQGEALGKFQDLATTALFESNIASDERIDATYRRIGYLEYFSNAVSNVPSEIPHEQGKLLKQSLTFSLLPRFLAPNKGVKDDKAKVEKYTDFYFGEYGGSSFSLGHYCEAYIDWGALGMILHLYLFGVFGGSLFLLILARTSNLNALLALGLMWVCMKPWGTFQQDMVTMSGQVVWGATCHLVVFFPLYKRINRWIQQ